METLIPISLFLMIAVIIVTPVYLSYLSRVKELETLSKLAESSVENREELLKLIQERSSQGLSSAGYRNPHYHRRFGGWLCHGINCPGRHTLINWTGLCVYG